MTAAGSRTGRGRSRTRDASHCACGAELGPTNKTGRCRRCSSIRALRRAVPSDFVQRAATMTNAEMCLHYGAGSQTITRWRKATNAPTVNRGGSVKWPVPDGFALVAPGMTIKELRVRYACSRDLIARWCEEVGVQPRRPDPARTVGQASKTFSPRNAPSRDGSVAGQAAEFLRRFGPVYRCTEDGKQDLKGTHWNRGGRTVLTDAELIERAKRNGWDPDAWRVLAA
jgi:hypothetical protein